MSHGSPNSESAAPYGTGTGYALLRTRRHAPGGNLDPRRRRGCNMHAMTSAYYVKVVCSNKIVRRPARL